MAAGTPRTPPHATEAETALIGAALIGTQALHTLVTATDPADYYQPTHRRIAGLLTDLYETGTNLDIHIVINEARRRWPQEPASQITDLLAQAGLSSHAERYAQAIHNTATRRRLIHAATETVEAAHSLDADNAQRRAAELLDDVGRNNGHRTYSTMEPADLAELVTTNQPAEDPTILTRTDGQALLYAGRTHYFAAEPESAKSWIALHACHQTLTSGGSAIYLDLEDTDRGMANRIRALAINPDHLDRLAYYRLHGSFGIPERTTLMRRIEDLNPDLIIIDTVAKALAAEGLDENDAGDYLGWQDRVAEPLADTGAAVLLIDHVAKSREQRGRWMRGSGAKLGGVSGVSYELRVIRPFSRHEAGTVRLKVNKDRPGGVHVTDGRIAAIATITPTPDGHTTITLNDPTNHTTSEPWRPTGTMSRVAQEIENTSGELAHSAIRNLCATIKPKVVDEAIARLVADGYIAQRHSGRSTYYRAVHPYGDTTPPPSPTKCLSHFPKEKPTKNKDEHGQVGNRVDRDHLEPIHGL